MANANGWGDGSVNNNIGWGQAPNNNISWGKSQITSWSGATDIDGGNAPVNTVAPAITGTAQEGQTLTCSTGTWTGNPTPTYSYQWKRNGSNIGSATNSTYILVTADVGQSIKCTVTATNFIGSANADSNTVTPTSAANLLLDTYPSAAVAYSLRKLRTAYSGSAIRVRRSSDNAEQNIGFVSNVLDTASLLTFCGAGSGYITTWYDQSGNGRNTTQSTATSQPMIIVAGALVTRGGKPALSFFDPIANLNNSLINSTIGFPVNNVSHFAVSSKRINGANLRAIYSTGILGPFDGFGLFYNTDETLYYQARAGVSITTGGAYANVNNTNNLIFGVLQPSTDNHWFNGANNVATSHTRPNANSISPLTIGNISLINWPHNGTISEVVFWNANQTTNRTGIETNVNSFYSIY